jgi:hypothetical protein
MFNNPFDPSPNPSPIHERGARFPAPRNPCREGGWGVRFFERVENGARSEVEPSPTKTEKLGELAGLLMHKTFSLNSKTK